MRVLELALILAYIIFHRVLTNMKNILLILILTISSCSGKMFGRDWRTPYTLSIEKPPPGPPIFQKGWSEGCESGYNSYTQSFGAWTGASSWKQDVSLLNDKMYMQAWGDAFLYCAWRTETNNQSEF